VCPKAVLSFIKSLLQTTFCVSIYIPPRLKVLYDKLEYNPGYLTLADDEPKDMLLVSTSDGFTFIYEKNKLLWKAFNKLIRPVAVLLLKVNDIPGFQLYMSRTGQLQIAYLGTKGHSKSIFETAPKEIKNLEILKKEFLNLKEAVVYTGGKKYLEIEALLNEASQALRIKNNSSELMNSLVFHYRACTPKPTSRQQFLGSLGELIEKNQLIVF
jgi:hypothetical protein